MYQLTKPCDYFVCHRPVIGKCCKYRATVSRFDLVPKDCSAKQITQTNGINYVITVIRLDCMRKSVNIAVHALRMFIFARFFPIFHTAVFIVLL